MKTMDNLMEQCGYTDTIFLTEVPEYFFCAICHLVLRKPKQLIICGHKFCHSCFERFNCFSINTNQPLLCPIDRTAINLKDVIPDVGTERAIGNLLVVCANKGNGCVWEGDLRDMASHLKTCECKRKSSLEEVANPKALKDIVDRMMKLEERFSEKEKESAFLKFNYQELKQEMTEIKAQCINKDEVIATIQLNYEQLKKQNIEINERLEKNEERNLKNEKEITSLKLTNQNLEKDNRKLKEAQISSNKKLEELSLRLETDIRDSSDNTNAEVAKLRNEIKNFQLVPINQSNMGNPGPSSVVNTVIPSAVNQTQVQPFFDIDIDGVPAGRIVLKMYFDVAPLNCTKFVDLCANKYGCSYRGATFNVCDDFCRADNLYSDSGKLVYCPPDLHTRVENLSAQHQKGVVTMVVYDDGGDVTKSAFFILFKRLANVNGKKVIIGEVRGDTWHVMEKMRKVGGGWSRRVKIVNCGVE